MVSTCRRDIWFCFSFIAVHCSRYLLWRLSWGGDCGVWRGLASSLGGGESSWVELGCVSWGGGELHVGYVDGVELFR